MKLNHYSAHIRPDYYGSFRCIADKCQHNCCIGWEIDIDDNTLKKYNTQNGALLERLQKSIALEPCAHFILGQDERCPFLNRQNLCELIIEGGEDLICDICKEHPRFYNEVYGVLEKGIGLSCEAAARIILGNSSRVKLICDCDMPKNDFFEFRNTIFSILQNREKTVNERICELLDFAGVSLPKDDANWIDVYRGLERLDTDWDKYLDSSATINSDIPKNLQIPFEQLLCYFVYRHLSGGLEDFLFDERIQFAVLSCFIINSLNRSNSFEEVLEIARLYSSEIEYSDENVEILLQILNKYNQK